MLELMQGKGFRLREWERPGKRRDREGQKHSLCPAVARVGMALDGLQGHRG